MGRKKKKKRELLEVQESKDEGLNYKTGWQVSIGNSLEMNLEAEVTGVSSQILIHLSKNKQKTIHFFKDTKRPREGNQTFFFFFTNKMESQLKQKTVSKMTVTSY